MAYKKILSGSTDGKPIKILGNSHVAGRTDNAYGAQLIHTALRGTQDGYDEIWLWAQNSSSAASCCSVDLTVEFGGTSQSDWMLFPLSSGNPLIHLYGTQNTQSLNLLGAVPLVQGLPLQNGASVYAYVGGTGQSIGINNVTASNVNVIGYVVSPPDRQSTSITQQTKRMLCGSTDGRPIGVFGCEHNATSGNANAAAVICKGVPDRTTELWLWAQNSSTAASCCSLELTIEFGGTTPTDKFLFSLSSTPLWRQQRGQSPANGNEVLSIAGLRPIIQGLPLAPNQGVWAYAGGSGIGAGWSVNTITAGTLNLFGYIQDTTKRVLSASNGGRPIRIAAGLSSQSTLLHTAVPQRVGSKTIGTEEIWLWGQNTCTAATVSTSVIFVEVGGNRAATDAGDGSTTFVFSLSAHPQNRTYNAVYQAPGVPLTPLLQGFALTNGQTVRVYLQSDTAVNGSQPNLDSGRGGAVLITGYVTGEIVDASAWT